MQTCPNPRSFPIARNGLETPEPEKQKMWRRKRATAKSSIALGLGLSFIVAPLAGCDSSTAVKEIPEQAKKALIQRKVDVTPGTARSSRTGAAPAKGRASGR
jgi:hypothetical protein